MKPINLKEMLGKRYRITWDEAKEPKTKADPWLMQIPCRYGMIYPYGGKLLAVECDYHPGLGRRLRDLGLVLSQGGDQEKTFLFPMERFEEVAAIVKPKKKRQLTEEQRKMAQERLATWRGDHNPSQSRLEAS